MKTTYTRQHDVIRHELRKLGINKAIAANTTYDGTSVVLLRWNEQEEHVSANRLGIGDIILSESDEEYISWLHQVYADVNLAV